MRALLLGTLLLAACDQRIEAYIECAPAGTAFQCGVTHRQGSMPLTACWDVVVVCQNGTRTSAHACQDVAPGAKAARAMPVSDFPGQEKCDTAASTTVENITVKAK